MSYTSILKVLGTFLVLFASVLLIPLVLAVYYDFFADPTLYPQPHSTESFIITIAICLGLGFLCLVPTYRTRPKIFRKEALTISVLIWFITPLIGSLPFIFSGTLHRIDQAYLEAVSGLTSTGVTTFEAKNFDLNGQEIPVLRGKEAFFGTIHPITNPLTGEKLEGFEAINKAILFWRSFNQWLGGIGIIVLFVALLPALGVDGKFLFQTEIGGVDKAGFTPRIKETAFSLLKIYAFITCLEATLLFFTNAKMSLLDAIAISFSTAATGGLVIHQDSIAYYQSSATDWIVLIFMFFSGVNLTIYYYLLKGKIYRFFDKELFLYVALIILFSLFGTWFLTGHPIISLSGERLGDYSPYLAFKDSLFHYVSSQTTTGFFISNYEAWPLALQALLLISMMLGAMAGSTTGGIKLIRIAMLYEIVKNKIQAIFMPKNVKILRVGEKVIDSGTATAVLSFFFLVVFFFVVGTFVFIVDLIDGENALTLAAALVTNTGFGFKLNGPLGSVAFLSPISSVFASFLMVLGRLEFFAVLALLHPSFWKD